MTQKTPIYPLKNAPNKGNIYWLASYPKSGNTWTRAFIANLLNENIGAVDINMLDTGAIASGRGWVENALDFDINELSHDEIDKLRPSAYCWLSQQITVPEYHKIHDAYTLLPNGQALIPKEATKGALYIMRNPLDVAVSFAHHLGCSIDQSITNMSKSNFSFAGKSDRSCNQLRQQLLSWSGHVTSWVDDNSLNRLVVRYEDMQVNPLNSFGKIARFLKLPSNDNQVLEALSHCRIDKLQAQEAKSAFKEKSAKAATFFRKGIVGDWQNTLTKSQINTLINDHREVMQRFGYLDAQEQPICDFSVTSKEDKSNVFEAITS